MKKLAGSLALSFVLAASLCAEEAIQVKLRYIHKEGDKTTHHEAAKSKFKLVITAGKETVEDIDQKKDQSVTYTTEVIKVEDGYTVEGKHKFTEATHLVDGESEDFSLTGKTVLSKKGKAGWEYFHEDGSKMSESEAAEAADALGDKDDTDKKDKDKKDKDDLMCPKQPVKVGDSWDIDLKEFAQNFGGGEEGAVDLGKSKGSLKLISAEKRDDMQCGKIEGEIELVMLKVGPLVLDKPLQLKLSVTIEGCLDGTKPSGTITMKGGMSGKRVADAEGHKADLEIDMAMEMLMTQEPAK